MGTPISGSSPLAVQFTDTSTNTPTGWTWYFGDKGYTAPWTQVNASPGWTARRDHSSVALPDGSIILMGGIDGSIMKNDVWRSTDNGATWILVNASSGWTPRREHSSVAMPDGSIILTGGADSGGITNDTWRSTDNGATWTRMTANAKWSKRSDHSSVAMPDGSIVLAGGWLGYGSYVNDTWRSINNGTSWMQMNASSGWTARYHPSSVVLLDGSISLMGGEDNGGLKNDTWQSTDNGATWTRMTTGADWSARREHTSVVMRDNSILLMGGEDSRSCKNDTWRSTDNGATWIQVSASSGWTPRGWHTSVVVPDGSVILAGGLDGDGSKRDVWRLVPAESSVQNPLHTYTTPGNYTVVLQANNAGGYNITQKTGYITVTGSPPAPVANFTANVTSGLLPRSIKFTDTSTNSPIMWNWSFGDSAYSSLKNPDHTYVMAGNHTVTLTASNTGGANTTVSERYIIIYPKGDFNHNWRVDVGDATFVAYMVIGKEPEQIPDADFNANSIVDIGDAAKIAYFVVGKIPAL
ncbi:MAG: hypothetical protein STSR0009_00700 [Methanoregula sp.]